jgi:group I intron endonuclease
MKISGIYWIRNLVNGKVYIGSSIDIKNRWSEHRGDLQKNNHCNDYLQKSWNKYGEQSFIFEMVEKVERDKEKIINREQYYLDLYKSYEKDVGYNICSVAYSCLGIKCSEETKRKIGEANKGKLVGKNSPFFGIPRSEEIRKKMSESQKGRKHTKESKEKMSKARLGKKYAPCSEERKEKIGKANSGENCGTSKLTWEIVDEIRSKYIPKIYGYRKLAKEYKTTPSHILSIVTGKIWKEENRPGLGENNGEKK